MFPPERIMSPSGHGVAAGDERGRIPEASSLGERRERGRKHISDLQSKRLAGYNSEKPKY